MFHPCIKAHGISIAWSISMRVYTCHIINFPASFPVYSTDFSDRDLTWMSYHVCMAHYWWIHSVPILRPASTLTSSPGICNWSWPSSEAGESNCLKPSTMAASYRTQLFLFSKSDLPIDNSSLTPEDELFMPTLEGNQFLSRPLCCCFSVCPSRREPLFCLLVLLPAFWQSEKNCLFSQSAQEIYIGVDCHISIDRWGWEG